MAVCVAGVVTVIQGQLTTFAWRIEFQFSPVIEELSYHGPEHGMGPGHWFWVTVRPDASQQDLESLISTVDSGWWHSFRSERDHDEVKANGIAFCRKANHADDRLRLREALRAIGASLTVEWGCDGYPLPDRHRDLFARFAADTETVGRALEATGETGPVMIADDVDWAALSHTLPPVVDAVTPIAPVEWADLSTQTVTLWVQPTLQLDQANRAATAVAEGRIAVTVKNA